MKEWLKKMAKELGLPETASEEEVLAKVGEQLLSANSNASALSTRLSTVAAQLAAHHDLKVELTNGEVKIVKASAPVGDPADKARIATLELANAKSQLAAAKVEVDAIMKAGKVPPSVKAQLERVFATTGKLESLQLSKDGAGTEVIIKGTVDVLADLKAIFEAIPGIAGSKLSSLAGGMPNGDAGKVAGEAGKAAAQRLLSVGKRKETPKK